MRWEDVRVAHPDQWLVVEALDAHSENDHEHVFMRNVDRFAVGDHGLDGFDLEIGEMDYGFVAWRNHGDGFATSCRRADRSW